MFYILGRSYIFLGIPLERFSFYKIRVLSLRAVSALVIGALESARVPGIPRVTRDFGFGGMRAFLAWPRTPPLPSTDMLLNLVKPYEYRNNEQELGVACDTRTKIQRPHFRH